MTHLSGDNVLDGHQEFLWHVEGDVAQTHDGGAEVWTAEGELFLDFLKTKRQGMRVMQKKYILTYK